MKLLAVDHREQNQLVVEPENYAEELLLEQLEEQLEEIGVSYDKLDEKNINRTTYYIHLDDDRKKYKRKSDMKEFRTQNTQDHD